MSDVVRPCGKGPGLVPPAPRLPVRSMLSAPSPPPPPPQGPGRIGVFRAALSAVVPALWAAILGGPSHGKVTTGGGRPVLRARLSEAVALLPLAPHSLLEVFAGKGCPLCGCCLYLRLLSVSGSSFLRIRGDEEKGLSASTLESWAWGLQCPLLRKGALPCSVPPPGRGGSEKEGVRDPAFWARKVAKAEVRGISQALWP